MRKKFLIEATYEEQQEIWVAVSFNDDLAKVMLHIYPKKEIDKKILQQWVRGEKELPATALVIERTIADENLLTEEIRVENVGKVRDIEIEWANSILQSRMLQNFHNQLAILKEKIAVLDDYSQTVFEECVAFWDSVMDFKKDNATFSNQSIDELKTELDILFDALKALRKDYKKEQKERSKSSKDELMLKLELLANNLKEKGDHKFVIQRLKEVRASLNKAGLIPVDYQVVDKEINQLFDTMSAKRDENRNKKTEKRIGDLTAIVEKMQKSLDWDERELKKQEKFKERTDQIFQLKLVDAKIDMIQNRIKEKQTKLKNIKATLASLEKKTEE